LKERILKEEQAKREKEQQDKLKAQKTSPTPAESTAISDQPPSSAVSHPVPSMPSAAPSFNYNQTTTVTGTFTTNTLTQAAKQLNNTADDLKRTQSIQEMREMEKRRREEIAGKIDMNEQHTLMSQFEQSFMPKFL
jgi:hypothetical protein